MTDQKQEGTGTAAATIEGETVTLKKRTQALVRALDAKREDLTRALGSRVDPDIFIQIVANAYMKDPQLLRCSQMSIYVAAMEAARTGLRPDGEEAVIVGYRDRDSGEVLAQFQPMYQGLVRLMLRAGARKVWAHVVHSGDTFEYELGTEPRLVHRPCPFGQERGEIEGAYAVVMLANGETQFEVMDKDELEKVRQSSKVPNSPAYRGWLSEMYRKAPLRRLRKWVEMDSQASAAFRLDADLESGARGRRLGDYDPEHEGRTLAERAESTSQRLQSDLRNRLKELSGGDQEGDDQEDPEQDKEPALSDEDKALLREGEARAKRALAALQELSGEDLEDDQVRLSVAVKTFDLEALIQLEQELRDRAGGAEE